MAKTPKLRTVVGLLALLIFLEVFLELSVGITSGKTRQTKQQQSTKADKPAQTNQTNQKSQEEAVQTLTTELVQLDAVISDKSGKLITNLKKEDFEVLEDG